MNKILTFLVFAFLIACTTKKDPLDTTDWKPIEIGEFTFNVPADFKLVEEQGMDTYMGKIKSDSLELEFNLGYYTKKFPESPEEFLKSRKWLLPASVEFMKEGITYGQTNMPQIQVLNIRPATKNDTVNRRLPDFIARCQHTTTVFDEPIFLPAETKDLTITVETKNNEYRKTVAAKNPKTGLTGIYISPTDAPDPDAPNADDWALSITGSNLTKTQQELALKIFETGQHKAGK